VYHGGDIFSKFLFKQGKYDNMTVSEENSTIVRYYSLKMALESKRLNESQLVNDLNAQIVRKT